MLESPVLIAIIVVGIVVLLALIAVYLKSRGAGADDSQAMLVNINSSLDDIMNRVDSLEAQRKAGVTTESASEPNGAADNDVEDFLSQFDSGAQSDGEEEVASEVFGVQDAEAGVSNDDFWSDFDRPLKKLDGHDRETQASLKPRSDRPMRLSRQTLVPQDEEQAKMQEEIRRQTVQHMYQQSDVEQAPRQNAMPQYAENPSRKPASRDTFVQPLFIPANQGKAQSQPHQVQPAAVNGRPAVPMSEPKVQPLQADPGFAPQPESQFAPRPESQFAPPASREPQVKPITPNTQQVPRPVVRPAQPQHWTQPVQPVAQQAQPMQQTMQQPATQQQQAPAQPQHWTQPVAQQAQPMQQTMQQPAPQQQQAPAQPQHWTQPVQPVAQQAQPMQQTMQQPAPQQQQTPAQPQHWTQPVQSAAQQAQPMQQTMQQPAPQQQQAPVQQHWTQPVQPAAQQAQPHQAVPAQPQQQAPRPTQPQPAQWTQPQRPPQQPQVRRSRPQQSAQAMMAQWSQPVQPARQAQPAPQTPGQQSFVIPEFMQARPSQPSKPPEPAQPKQAPDGNIKYTDRTSGTDKQGRSYSVEELMQQIR